MSRKQFTISYPDGSKKNIGAAEREQMLLAGEIVRVDDDTRYKWAGEVKTFHSFADLQALRSTLGPSTTLRRFLPGSFIVEYPRRLGAKRAHELLETAEALALRLPQIVAKLNESVPVAGFEAAA